MIYARDIWDYTYLTDSDEATARRLFAQADQELFDVHQRVANGACVWLPIPGTTNVCELRGEKVKVLRNIPPDHPENFPAQATWI